MQDSKQLSSFSRGTITHGTPIYKKKRSDHGKTFSPPFWSLNEPLYCLCSWQLWTREVCKCLWFIWLIPLLWGCTWLRLTHSGKLQMVADLQASQSGRTVARALLWVWASHKGFKSQIGPVSFYSRAFLFFLFFFGVSGHKRWAFTDAAHSNWLFNDLDTQLHCAVER